MGTTPGSPAARARRRAPEQRRDQLLDAAERVLLRRGLADATVADVAQEAEVAKGTVYLYFESKDALIAALRARYLAEFAAAVNAGVTSGRASPSTRIDRFVDGLFEFSIRHSALHHVLFHEAGFSEHDALAGGRAVLQEIIAQGVRAREFGVRDPERAAAFIIHALHGMVVDAIHGPAAQRTAAQAAARDLVGRTVRA